MATLTKIKNAIISTITGAPGKSMKVDTEGLGKSSDDAELYHLPGIFSRPHDDVQGVNIDVNGLNIIIATHDYKLDKSLDKGEAIIYSVNASGTILSSVLLNNNSEVVVNDGTDYAVAFEDLKTVVEELQNDLTALKSAMGSGWVVVPTDGGAALKAAITTWFGTAISGNMDNTKVEKVRLP